ncbi:Sulfotransferase domain-containing protein [Ekhidna lutea]|uniref:Sulfotransferase domain-containing protein n=1 Tax=Ekhidna lutea TaxID=447679 RepID=A0A239FG78_EKHLU|nr:sulfotransferase domain-containing protein [Ekhidna lutea]SNS55771.1 Sulfotransferase domain-containing protein [Ekhidna lutea]
MDLKKLGSKIQPYANKLPSPLLLIYLKIASISRKAYYKNESKLINGKLEIKSEKQSVIFFTIHKCASTFLNNQFNELLKNTDYTMINTSSYFTKEQRDYYYSDSSKIKSLFKPKGIWYGPYRFFIDVPNLNHYKVILILRDPRDVLTSYYFTAAFNHPISDKAVIEERKEAQALNIDEYVIKKSELFYQRYFDYLQKVKPLQNVLLLKYEDMIVDYNTFLSEISDFVGMDENEKIHELVGKSSFKVDKEDPNSFIRNIKAGDHKEKLKPETISFLNKKFAKILEGFNYPIS